MILRSLAGRRLMEADTSAVGNPEPRRWLRLVVVDDDDLGPISPELALVCPELAEAARRALPDPPWLLPRASERLQALDAAAATPQAPGPGEANPARGEPDRLHDRGGGGEGESVQLDTADRRLKEHGLSLVRRRLGSAQRWTLTLPRGEVVDVDVEAPREDPPEPIETLLAAVLGDERVGPLGWESDHPGIARLQEQVWAQRHALIRHDPGTRLATDPENLHQFRVAGRRLRAFLRIGRKVLDPDWSKAVRDELGRLAERTGPVRDLDVLLDGLRAELEQLDEADRTAGEALVARLELDRHRAQRELVDRLDESSYLRLLDWLGQPVQVVPRPVTFSLRKLARREVRKLVREVVRLGGDPTDEQLHGLRIRVKRARYSTELAGRSGRAASRVIDAARSLQDLLGDHQDAAVAEQRLREAAGSASPAVAFVAGRLAERQREKRERLRSELPEAWKELRRVARKLS